jgi:sugar phosphate permease
MDIDYARPPADAGRLRRWQAATLALLVAGYAGYYLCRSHFSVTKPLIMAEMVRNHLTTADPKTALGDVATVGTALYAVGKFLGGVVGDLLGGRRNFLLGMGGAILFTALFAASGSLPLFTLCWAGNRLLQAFGWPGLVKIGGRWTPYRRHGLVMGVLSLSFLFGDAVARVFMGKLMAEGLGWRGVFLVAAAVLGGLFILTYALLKESPTAAGLPEFPPSPQTVYDDPASDEPLGDDLAGDRPAENAASKGAVGGLLSPLLASPAFWVVCGLSLAATLARETFNDWTPTYFVERLKMPPAEAASTSAVFPFLGGCSVLVFGYASDRLGRPGRAASLTAGLGLCGVALWLLASAATPAAGTALVAVVGFLLVGPYSFLAGAIALDFGGRRGGATAAGLIDGVGYVGGILAGSYVSRLAAATGWGSAFAMLAVVIWAAAGLGVVYLVLQVRAGRRIPSVARAA